MEISLVNAASTAPAGTDATVANTVLRKSLDIQQQNIASLLQALPEPQTYSNPPNLGQNVDVKA
ncbi:YjfB family protein [Chitiniphilus purpureus]|uniref:YjfB family protein n=1 Tax=Chitiniphilus purpureus TaxID=2981137 RepID=A0ABY6DSG9_9NEIS|nr:YjfB family protein [Chitiniphilus sp. CD1]UXY17178.1 YjfB family protein [Chitiniphilus sp. CD1]